MSWEMVPVEAAAEASAPLAATPEADAAEAPTATEADTESCSFEDEPARFEQVAAAVVEESAADTHVVEAHVDEARAIEAVEKPFDPDATQALPEEFFTQGEPQLETTAELVGASIPGSTVEHAVEPEPEAIAAVVEEPTIEEHIVAPVVEAEDPTVFEPQQEPQPDAEPELAVKAHVEAFQPAAPMTSVATEPAILSVGPEPPSIVEEELVESPTVEQVPPVEAPAIAAAAAAGAGVLSAAIAEQFQHVSNPPLESETAPGDQTQIFIASAVARVLDRMKPTLIEEIAREMSNRRKPRKDPEE
jgi:hypothetical protein